SVLRGSRVRVGGPAEPGVGGRVDDSGPSRLADTDAHCANHGPPRATPVSFGRGRKKRPPVGATTCRRAPRTSPRASEASERTRSGRSGLSLRTAAGVKKTRYDASVRAHAYQLPSEVYRELEAQILEALRGGSLEQLGYLLAEHDLKIDLLSGEWRVLFEATRDISYQGVDLRERRARMAVSPDELAAFVELLREPARQADWAPISFGLAELVDALPAGVDMVGLVVVEEDDDWMWSESTHEIIAIRPEVYTLIEPHMRRLVEVGDFAALARLCGDHCEGAIEFSTEKIGRAHV